jgi:hypothetical protein
MAASDRPRRTASPPPAVPARATSAAAPTLPASRGKLSGAEAQAAPPVVPDTTTAADRDTVSPPSSRDELFGIAPPPAAKGGGPPSERSGAQVRGFVQFAPAYTFASPGHWSRAVVRTQGEVSGQLSAGVKGKASLRVDLDPVYMASDFYPSAVREDQRAEVMVRETYLDVGLPGNWEMRLGRQHIVWGEVVGLFVADVVSARDVRDFILPDFDILRIPQWAARGEYFGGDWHAELLWIPFPSYDEIGKPGAEFYPFPIPETPGFAQTVLDDRRPARTLEHTNYGARISRLVRGWDLSTFYYSSMSASPTLYRTVSLSPTPMVAFEPRHDRIEQVGAALSKDLARVVVHAEAVYTHGRAYEVVDMSRTDGAVRQDTFDYVVGLDFMLPRDGRVNLQGFQRYFLDHDSGIAFDSVESGVSLLVSGKLTQSLVPEILWIQSLNGNDRMLRPRVNWAVHPQLSARFGVDLFDGPQYGVFGRFDDRDRVYAELRYAF